MRQMRLQGLIEVLTDHGDEILPASLTMVVSVRFPFGYACRHLQFFVIQLLPTPLIICPMQSDQHEGIWQLACNLSLA